MSDAEKTVTPKELIEEVRPKFVKFCRENILEDYQQHVDVYAGCDVEWLLGMASEIRGHKLSETIAIFYVWGVREPEAVEKLTQFLSYFSTIYKLAINDESASIFEPEDDQKNDHSGSTKS
jgi:hypothetical protein